jgi:hypothetical protein
MSLLPSRGMAVMYDGMKKIVRAVYVIGLSDGHNLRIDTRLGHKLLPKFTNMRRSTGP